MMRTRLITLFLLLNAVSISALTGKIVLFPGLFKGWQFTGSFVFAKEQGRYYPVGPDGSFTIPSEEGAEVTLTAYVPGFNKKTETFSPNATDVNIVVQVQTVSMEGASYDAEIPKWVIDLKTDFKKDLSQKEDLASIIPFQVTTGIDGKRRVEIDFGRVVTLVEKLTGK